MNEPLFQWLAADGHPLFILTGWKLIGLIGALCFTLRWFVQAWHRHRTGSTAIPPLFWWISLGGAGMTLCYFVFGKNDSVGILQNLFPMSVAAYNIWLDVAHRRADAPGPRT